jgi:hypothetical protein
VYPCQKWGLRTKQFNLNNRILDTLAPSILNPRNKMGSVKNNNEIARRRYK